MPDRIVKESICTSETIDKLTWFEEVFWQRLTVNCDDYGRFDARPTILKSRLFPLKPKLADKAIPDALQRLADVNLITLYECDGKPYLQLVTWEKYQRIRAQRSKYPSPADACCQLTAEREQAPSNVPVIQSNPNPILIQSESKAIEPLPPIELLPPIEPEPIKEPKHKFGEFKHVRLTKTESNKLIEELGQETFEKCIKKLDEHIHEKGTKYQEHNLTIRRWVIDAVKQPNKSFEKAPKYQTAATYQEPTGKDDADLMRQLLNKQKVPT